MRESETISVTVREYTGSDLDGMIRIWNQVVEDGAAFPQEELLNRETGAEFFASQTFSAVAVNSAAAAGSAAANPAGSAAAAAANPAGTAGGEICGLYILHPNNIGRCGHIANASYAVRRDLRGLHIGEKLVSDCLRQAKLHGFRILQFNAVVASNLHARHLYERLGFIRLGTIPGGFRMKDGRYEDICPYYHLL